MDWLLLLSNYRPESCPSMPGDYLGDSFARDYDQIVTCPAFRRLQDKTQVFPLDRSDFVRTRLTHSLEVSSLASRLGRDIIPELQLRGYAPELDLRASREIADLLRSAGLLHDIGNPPFGHYGETTIRDWFSRMLPQLQFQGRPLCELLSPAQQADFCHFEGNAQALRVLCKLQTPRKLEDTGRCSQSLNLSYAVLNCLFKYRASSLELQAQSADLSLHKMGYFQAEAELFHSICKKTGCLGQRHPLTYLLEIADDLAYCSADIEDALRKGRFSYNQLVEALEDSPLPRSYASAVQARYQALIDGLKRLRDDARQERQSRPERQALSHWISLLREELLHDAAQAFAEHYPEIMAGQLLGSPIDGRISALVLAVLGQIAYDFVFSSRPIVQMEIGANTIIGGLLDQFIPAAIHWDCGETQSSLEPRLMAIISDNYKQAYFKAAQGQPEPQRLYHRLLLVTDYISGMTDRFCQDLYHRMRGNM